MKMSWTIWSVVSVAGFAASTLITARLTKKEFGGLELPPETVNLYLYVAGLAMFLFYAVFGSKASLDVPSEYRWWLLAGGATLFVANFAMLEAFSAAPNVGFVEGVVTARVVVVALATAALTHDWSTISWKTVAGMVLVLAGALVLGLGGAKKGGDDKEGKGGDQPAATQKADPKSANGQPAGE